MSLLSIGQLRPDRQFDIHIEQSFLDIVHREGTIGDDGLVRRADVGDEPFDVVERDLFGAADSIRTRWRKRWSCSLKKRSRK